MPTEFVFGPVSSPQMNSNVGYEVDRLRAAGSRALRVAFIVQRFPSISETFILDEIVGALRRGIDVDIYAVGRGTAADIHPQYVEYALHRRTFYGNIASSNRLTRIAAAVWPTVLMFGRQPAALFRCVVARRRGIQTRTFVGLARTFVRLGRQYDVVHAHFGPNGIRADVLRCAGVFDAPIVTTFHGYDATSFVARNGADSYAGLARNGDRFIAVSESMGQALQAIGIPQRATHVMPLGVDCRTFFPPCRREERNTIYVVSIGRLVEKKGFEYGIAAVAQAQAQGARLRYDIIGDGPLAAQLKARAAQLGVADVIFHGSQNRTAIAARLAMADIMLAPSVTAADGDQEGMPIVIKEAMALGLPVVATSHAGIPELVRHAQTGLLAAERDVSGLAHHLLALAADVEQRKRLGRAGRQLIEQRYDNEDIIDDLVALYRAVARADSRLEVPA